MRVNSECSLSSQPTQAPPPAFISLLHLLLPTLLFSFFLAYLLYPFIFLSISQAPGLLVTTLHQLTNFHLFPFFYLEARV